MLRVALLNGTDNNYDHNLTKMLSALIAGSCTVEGMAVTTNQVATGRWFLKAERTGGEEALILVDITSNQVIDTTGTKKVWIELDQAKIDDGDLINSNQDNVASINTGASYPAYEHIKLASIVSWVITDERVYVDMRWAMNNYGDESVDGNKTFADNILFANPPKSTQSGAGLLWVDDEEYITKYHFDNNPPTIPSAWEWDEGVVERLTESEADPDTATDTTRYMSKEHIKQFYLTIWDVINGSFSNGATVDYAHSLWKPPRLVIIFFEWYIMHSRGFWSEWGTGCMYWQSGSGSTKGTNWNPIYCATSSSPAFIAGTITVDETNVTITWGTDSDGSWSFRALVIW